MNKSMKPKAPIAPAAQMSEEQKKEQMVRAYLQKKASIAEGILFNLLQNPAAESICGGKSAVEMADEMSTEFMKVVYGQSVKEEA